MILEIDNVSKSFGGIRALQGCSFGIEESRITAIIGPNGSGKTTLFNAISRLLPIDEGTITFQGRDITALPDYKVARLGVSRTFQDVRLFSNLTIGDHLGMVLCDTDEQFFKSLVERTKMDTAKVEDILALVSLDKPLETYASDLSYGQRKLLDLAIAIGKPHTLLMLDEPVAGVNPRLRDDIKTILRGLNEDGETILLIEHDMNFVMDLVDHIVVMDAGKVIAEGEPAEIQNDPKVLEAYLGG